MCSKEKFMMQLWSQLKMVWVNYFFYTVLVEQGRHTFTTPLFLSCDQKKKLCSQLLPLASQHCFYLQEGQHIPALRYP
uniref:Uncharacterized protein n=1 Tax=Brassica oleracea TaxID=3712 RepID=A0A3P6EYX5_BRAOL|nr:unnamed protein product [Brassica oleracea]